MKRALYIIERLLGILGFLILFWIVASVIDINMHNSIGAGYGQYHAWNAFTLILNLMKGVC